MGGGKKKLERVHPRGKTNFHDAGKQGNIDQRVNSR